MAILTKEQYLERIKALVGEDTSDDSIALVADLTDTYNSLEKNSTGAEWEAKYNAEHEAHEKLRGDYMARFFAGNPQEPEPDTHGAEEITFDDLFN